MELTNNQLVALLLVTAILVVAAGFLTMTGGALGTATPVQSDPTLLVVVPELTRTGAVELRQGPVIVKLDKRQSSATAKLHCETFMAERHAEDGQIEFQAVPDETCTLQLIGTKRPYTPVFRGDTLTCSAMGEDTRCTGGIAVQKQASLTVKADVPAALEIDGKVYGALPQTFAIPAGRHNVELRLDDGRKVNRPLFVAPGETVEAFFPVNRQAPAAPEPAPPAPAPPPVPDGTAAAPGSATAPEGASTAALTAPAPAAAPSPAPASAAAAAPPGSP